MGIKLKKYQPSITNSTSFEVTSGTSLTGTVQANAGDYVLATVSIRSLSATPIPTGWTMIHDTMEPNQSYNQRLCFAYRIADISGAVSFTATQPTANRIYLNLISFSNVSRMDAWPQSEVTGNGELTAVNKQSGEMILWGCVSPLWSTSSPYGDWLTTPNDLTLISLNQAINPPRLGNFIDLGTGATNRTFRSSPQTAGNSALVCGLKIIAKQDTNGTYITHRPAPIKDVRLKATVQNFSETSTDFYYAYTETETQPEVWNEVQIDEVISSGSGYLWLKAELATDDETVSPEVISLHLEEAEANVNRIKINLTSSGRIKYPQGDITIAFTGVLVGIGGGFVAPFTETFTPVGITPIFNPNAPDHLTITSDFALAVKEVVYSSAKLDEPADQICILPPSMALTITHVGTLPL